jgi:hypothetical protein
MPPAVRAGGDLVVPPAVSNAMTVTQMAADLLPMMQAMAPGPGISLDSRGW